MMSVCATVSRLIRLFSIAAVTAQLKGTDFMFLSTSDDNIGLEIFIPCCLCWIKRQQSSERLEQSNHTPSSVQHLGVVDARFQCLVLLLLSSVTRETMPSFWPSNSAGLLLVVVSIFPERNPLVSPVVPSTVCRGCVICIFKSCHCSWHSLLVFLTDL